MNTAVTPVAPAASARAGTFYPTLAYFTAFMAMGLAGSALGPALPGLAEQLGAPLSAVSLLLAARSLGTLAGTFHGGWLYDRLPGHPVMGLALVLTAATMALVPLSAGLWPLVAVVTVMGAATGALNMGGNTLLYWVHRDQVAPYMNGLHFCFGVGAFLAPALIALVISATGTVTLAFWVLALLMLPVALWLLWLPSPAVQRPAPGHTSGPVDYRLAALFVVFFFAYVGAEACFGNWIYTYALTLGLADAAGAAYLASAFWVTMTLGRLLAIPLAVRLRPRTILMADLAGAILAAVFMLALPDSRAALWVGTLAMGLAMASVFPTALSFVQRRIPVTGRITAWFMLGTGVGTMVLPWLIGQWIEPFGARVILVVVLVDLAFTAVVFGVLLWGWREPTRDVRVYPG